MSNIISENEAARRLDVSRATLALWRKKGLLAPGLVLPPLYGHQPATGRKIRYLAAKVDEVALTGTGLLAESGESQSAFV